MNNTISLKNKDHDYMAANLWMGLGDVRELQIPATMLGGDWEKSNKIAELIVNTCLEPEYLHFFTKYILNIDIFPFQAVALKMLWEKKFPMFIATRGGSKSFTIAIYIVMRAMLHQGCTIAVTGASLRQSMVLFNYVENIWNNAPILRDICGGRNGAPKKELHMCSWRCGKSKVIFLPLGDGSKIRGQRANVVIADEYACLGKNTIVETSKGLMRIQDVFQEDIQAITFPNEKGKMVKAERYIKTPLTNVYKITTANGYSFRCSSIHQVKTIDGFKLAKDLTNKDFLLSPNYYVFPKENIKIQDLELDRELAWLFGILTSEGSINDKYTISVHMTDKECIDRVHYLLCKYSKNKVSLDIKESYEDERGWTAKKAWTVRVCDLELRNLFDRMGLTRTTAHDKQIPSSILQSPKNIVCAYLSGLFHGDGSCFHWNDKGISNHLGIAYYSVCEQLCDDVQFLLRKLNIFASKQSRESKLSDNLQWMLRLNGQNAFNLCQLLNIPKWNSTIESSHVKFDSPTKDITYCKDKEKYRTVVNYCGKRNFLGHYSSIEKAISARDNFIKDLIPAFAVKKVELLTEQESLYDFYIPETNSFNAANFIQHNSIPAEVFETVVRGFASVKSQGVFNTAVQAAKEKYLKDQNKEMPEFKQKLRNILDGNQIVIAG
ncbi:MAG TPA: LAGLIDADG family homing endonuclease, partial [Saprospiraceae bacterium]|nr:LAGLIDADG family homing endonuclease [Saprospiraceae bacterium]